MSHSIKNIPLLKTRSGIKFHFSQERLECIQSQSIPEAGAMERLSSPKVILGLTSATFFAYGTFFAGLGPVIGELASQTGLTLAGAGTIFTALFSGALLAQIGSGPISDRYGRKPLFVLSIVLFGSGTIGVLQSHTLASLLLWAFFAGLGQGGIDLAANLLIADTYRQNNLAALNLLHFAYGLGSSFGPALISYSLVRFNQGLPVLWGSAVFILMLGVFATAVRLKLHSNSPDHPSRSQTPEFSKSVYRMPLLWLLGALLLLIVGAEFGVGSWSTLYLTETTALSLETAALATSGFWAFLTLGRLAAAAASQVITARPMLLLNLSGALLGGVGLVLSRGSSIPTIIALLLIGFCYGGLYPLVISITTAAFHPGAGKATGVIIAMGSIGGLAVPAMAGTILINTGSRAYSWLIAALLGGMLCLYYWIQQRRPKYTEVEPAL